MGLDITGYKNLTKIDCVFYSDGDPINPVKREPVDADFFAFVNSDFEGRNCQIENRTAYKCDDSISFSAGSYSGYNIWRDQLARIAGYEAAASESRGGVLRHDQGAWNVDGGAFWEMINFSDCEGVIGADVSKKLFKDFYDFNDKASLEDEWFYDRYKLWMSAFEMASDNGAVEFS